MTEAPRMILHIGAPKSGSSALQAALSAQPVLRTPEATRLMYCATWTRAGHTRLVTGGALSCFAQASPFGYMSWPAFRPREQQAAAYGAELDRLFRGGAPDVVRVLSNEGWLSQADVFARTLPAWVGPGGGLSVFASARPPLEWLNAAWWQWGVWQVGSLHRWLESGFPGYTMGSQLQGWAALRGVRLSLSLERDAVAGFARAYAVPLICADTPNAALPPALMGVLLRNRRLRQTAHDSAVEFVFHRWCRVAQTPRLWAVTPDIVQRYRHHHRTEVDKLFALAPEAEVRRAVAERPGWRHESPYHDLMRVPPGRLLTDPEAQVALYHALAAGIGAAAAQLRCRAPGVPGVFATSAPPEDRDAVLCALLDRLIALDTRHRLRTVRWGMARRCLTPWMLFRQV